jgi:transcriptional activator SPT8
VYSLAVQSEGLWLLSGLESGGINLQSVRHDEGKRITCLRQHTSAVSVLTLAPDEKSFLSGSWDKSILDWDLENGKVKRGFEGSGGQLSSIECRPLSNLSVPEESASTPTANGTLASNNDAPPTNGILTNGVKHKIADSKEDGGSNTIPPGSPTDSLFGGNDGDSLFGDNEDGTGVDGTSTGNAFGDDDNEISRAITSEIHQHDDNMMDVDNDMLMGDVSKAPDNQPTGGVDSQNANSETRPAGSKQHPNSGARVTTSSAEKPDISVDAIAANTDEASDDQAPQKGGATLSDTTFLAASIDGTLRVWDRRQPNPVATMLPRNVPPWCMNACWSPDGNFIYAGRRNGTVEEYSLHKGLRDPERTFKFPQGSGPVSAVRAMPNGRHLVW